MAGWTPSIGQGGPKYLAIATALADDIRQGRLRPGERLPTQRELAQRLDVDLTTITRAFAEARRLGLIDATVGRGSFVRGQPGHAEPEVGVDLSMNAPPQPRDARLIERLRDGWAEVLAAPSALARMNYQDSIGIEADRAAGAAWLARRLGPLPVDRVLVVNGAQCALAAILAVLCRPGEALCAGELTYPGLRAAAELRGVRLVPVRQDEEGLDPDALDEACRSVRPRALYVVPTLDNPTTATLSATRRAAIVAVARRHDLAVIEDDAYGALPADAPAPIATLAPERTWHVASLSKCATPALRIAYVATPGLADTLRLGDAIRALSLMAPPLQAAIATRFAEDGTLGALAAAIRAENRTRQRLARGILHGLDIAAHEDGQHLWLRLPTPWRRGEFVARARESGLSIVPSDAFALTAVPPEAVRLSLGIARDTELLGRALGVLAAILARPAGLGAIV